MSPVKKERTEGRKSNTVYNVRTFTTVEQALGKGEGEEGGKTVETYYRNTYTVVRELLQPSWPKEQSFKFFSVSSSQPAIYRWAEQVSSRALTCPQTECE